jgi:hypothetical protein
MNKISQAFALTHFLFKLDIILSVILWLTSLLLFVIIWTLRAMTSSGSTVRILVMFIRELLRPFFFCFLLLDLDFVSSPNALATNYFSYFSLDPFYMLIYIK